MHFLTRPISAAPLAVFRILFGLLMAFSLLRFWSYGWIEKLYLQPDFHFSYYGFEWVQPFGQGTYLLFIVGILSALAMAAGLWYRVSAVLFFLSFTYIELMDKTTYLNHYYFISVMSFLMIFLPAHRHFSLYTLRFPQKAVQQVPAFSIYSLRLLLGLVYFYAGLAKLNSEWLLHARPLSIWLPGRSDLPLIGSFMDETWLHYAFSWGGALYDLAIPFLLLSRRWRPWAFALVVIFHLMTRWLFPIGMFPYIMIFSTLIFFSAGWHERVLTFLQRFLGCGTGLSANARPTRLTLSPLRQRAMVGLLIAFFALQMLLPWRYALYPGELFWHEQGYRFSWRVMLMEKAGALQYRVQHPHNGTSIMVEPSRYLTPLQEKQLAFQPDFILEFAHFLAQEYRKEWHTDSVAVFAESYVALNGRGSRRYVNPEVNLAAQPRGWQPKTWLLPFKDTIYGL